jgi:hypothetical protein
MFNFLKIKGLKKISFLFCCCCCVSYSYYRYACIILLFIIAYVLSVQLNLCKCCVSPFDEPTYFVCLYKNI